MSKMFASRYGFGAEDFLSEMTPRCSTPLRRTCCGNFPCARAKVAVALVKGAEGNGYHRLASGQNRVDRGG
jgi:hypothetical protein